MRLQELDPSVVNDVLEFMYTGKVNLSSSSDMATLRAADFLLLPELRDLAVKSLELRLDKSTCLSFHSVADQHYCEDLKLESLNVIVQYFEDLSKSEEFLALNAAQLDAILGDEKLRACKQETVSEALTRWTKYDKGREGDFVELFKHIDLGAMDPDVRAKIATDELVQRKKECSEQVEAFESAANETDSHLPSVDMKAFFVKINENDGLFYVLAEDRWYKKSKLKIPRCLTGENWHETRKIISHNKKIYMFDPYPIGECKFYSYDIEEDVTVQLRPPPYVVPYYTAAVHDNALYLLGQHGFPKFQRYHILEKKWDTVELKDKQRNCQTLVTDGNFLYTIGGTMSSDEASSSIDRYDPRTGTWLTLPPMIECLHTATAFASNGYISVRECEWGIYSPYAKNWFNLTEKGKYFGHQYFRAVRGNIWDMDGVVYLFCLGDERKDKCCFAYWDLDTKDWKTTSTVSIPWDWNDDAGVHCCGPVMLSRKFLRGSTVVVEPLTQ